MGTRIIRIVGSSLGANTLQKYIGTVVDAVFASGSTHHGRLTQVDDSAIVLTDLNTSWYNRAQHRHRYAYTDLQEICINSWTPH